MYIVCKSINVINKLKTNYEFSFATKNWGGGGTIICNSYIFILVI